MQIILSSGYGEDFVSDFVDCPVSGCGGSGGYRVYESGCDWDYGFYVGDPWNGSANVTSYIGQVN